MLDGFGRGVVARSYGRCVCDLEHPLLGFPEVVHGSPGVPVGDGPRVMTYAHWAAPAAV